MSPPASAQRFDSPFSFLFGIGFAVFLARAERKGAAAVGLFRRRLLGLLLIGLAHTTLLWFGDILTLYALLGVALIPFRRVSNRALLRAAVIVLLLPIPLYGLTALALAAATDGAAGGGGLPPVVRSSLEAFRTGSYWEVVLGNVIFTAVGMVRRLLSMQVVRVFGKFMLGVWAGRVGLFANLAAHRPLFKRLLLAGAVVGLPGSVAFALLPAGGLILTTMAGWPRAAVESIATPLLALGYASTLALLFTYPGWQRFLLVFAPVGRMALTNYLLQSVVLVGAFYGIGLGLWGQVSHTTALLVAASVFAVQVPLSAFWLRRCTYGPVEWVWRQFTYGHRMPLARSRFFG